MRNELNEMEIIERYLLNTLSNDEKIAFEQRLKTDVGLQKNVEAQALLMESIKNKGVKSQIKKAKNKLKWNSFKKWFLGGLALVALILAVQIYVLQLDKNDTKVVDLSQAGASLANQEFVINGNKDTVIHTQEGIIFVIKAGTFLNVNNQVVEGEIKVNIQEALSAQAIMRSGLSTLTTNGELLETGGMFNIKATFNQEDLKIDPNKGIYSQIPTNDIKADMKLWQGVKQANGQILWDNPVDLVKSLICVDMDLLNFYPPQYEEKLMDFGFPNATKTQKDSVYYSFATHFDAKGRSQFLDKDRYQDPNAHIDEINEYKFPLKIGLNPIKVKAFWNKKFNNTLLATREFEKRMPVIHQTGSSEILDLYIQNLDKNLWEIDELAAQKSLGKLAQQFLNFASLKEGKVDVNLEMQLLLQKYYIKNEENYKNTLNKVYDYWHKQQKADEKEAKMDRKHNVNEAIRINNNLVKEFNDNLDTVYKQLNIKTINKTDYYKVQIINTGWHNIDRIVLEATINRQSTEMEFNGKKAVINYTKLNVYTAKFDRVFAYVLTPKLPSFSRMQNAKDTVFTPNTKGKSKAQTFSSLNYKLNDYYNYALAVIAYKGDSVFTYFEENIQYSKTTDKRDLVMDKFIDLQYGNEKEFFKTIAGFTGTKEFKKEIKSDVNYHNFKHQNNLRRIKQNEMIAFRRAIQEFVFPLYYLSAEHYLSSLDDNLDVLKNPFPITDMPIVNSKSLVMVKCEGLEDDCNPHTFYILGKNGESCVMNTDFLDTISDIGTNNWLLKNKGNDYVIEFTRDNTILSSYALQKEGNYWVAKTKNRILKFVEYDFESVEKLSTKRFFNGEKEL